MTTLADLKKSIEHGINTEPVKEGIEEIVYQVLAGLDVAKRLINQAHKIVEATGQPYIIDTVDIYENGLYPRKYPVGWFDMSPSGILSEQQSAYLGIFILTCRMSAFDKAWLTNVQWYNYLVLDRAGSVPGWPIAPVSFGTVEGAGGLAAGFKLIYHLHNVSFSLVCDFESHPDWRVNGAEARGKEWVWAKRIVDTFGQEIDFDRLKAGIELQRNEYYTAQKTAYDKLTGKTKLITDAVFALYQGKSLTRPEIVAWIEKRGESISESMINACAKKLKTVGIVKIKEGWIWKNWKKGHKIGG